MITTEGTELDRGRPEAADRDLANRPGVPRERTPEPWPNSRFPPERQRSRPSVFKRGRPSEEMPPVFGTAVPPRLASGRVRALAYRYPDHRMRHWMLLMLADRVDSFEHRVGKLLRLGAAAAALGLVGLGARRLARR